MKEVIEWKEWAKEKPTVGSAWYLVYGFKIKKGEAIYEVDKGMLQHDCQSWAGGERVVLFWAEIPKGPSAGG